MKFTVDKKEHYTLLSLKEEQLNSTIAPELKSEFVLLHSNGVQNLIFDMSDIKFVDSSGLSSILTADRLWKGQGTFILTGMQHENVQKLIKISRLETVFTIIPTVQESIDYILMESIERELNADSED
ncbi:MAG: STAS domain-containing protein [Bacteroidota bacterium]